MMNDDLRMMKEMKERLARVLNRHNFKSKGFHPKVLLSYLPTSYFPLAFPTPVLTVFGREIYSALTLHVYLKRYIPFPLARDRQARRCRLPIQPQAGQAVAPRSLPTSRVTNSPHCIRSIRRKNYAQP